MDQSPHSVFDHPVIRVGTGSGENNQSPLSTALVNVEAIRPKATEALTYRLTAFTRSITTESATEQAIETQPAGAESQSNAEPSLLALERDLSAAYGPIPQEAHQRAEGIDWPE